MCAKRANCRELQGALQSAFAARNDVKKAPFGGLFWATDVGGHRSHRARTYMKRPLNPKGEMPLYGKIPLLLLAGMFSAG